MVSFRKNIALRQQFAVGAQDALRSEATIAAELKLGLDAPVLRIFDRRRTFELNVTAAIIWNSLDQATSKTEALELMQLRYPTVGPKVADDFDRFIAECIRDGLIQLM